VKLKALAMLALQKQKLEGPDSAADTSTTNAQEGGKLQQSLEALSISGKETTVVAGIANDTTAGHIEEKMIPSSALNGISSAGFSSPSPSSYSPSSVSPPVSV